MKTPIRNTVLSLLIVAGLGIPENSDAVDLVQSGKPVSVIVLAEQPSDAARVAADDLQAWLYKVSGALVPISTENEVDKSEQNLILVGDTQRTRSFGIDPAEFELEEIVVETFPGALVVIGDDERPDGFPLDGTSLAVSTFAEQVLGIRLLWPGELGEVVPRQATIRLENIKISEKPVLVRRNLRNLFYSGAIRSKIDAFGWDHEIFQAMNKQGNDWVRFHRMGGSFNGRYGHSFTKYWDRFHEDHPDWFALQPDGTRDNSQPDTGGYNSQRLCVSNPGLIEQVAKDAIEALKANPMLDCVSVSPNDGGPQTFCLCEQCKSWDAPEGKAISMSFKSERIPYVSLTDRYVRFYSEVAKIVTKELPDRYIGAYAYHYYTDAPIHAQLHPNVVIGFVPETKMYMNEAERDEVRDNWLKWSEKAEHLFVRPNYLRTLQALPTVIVHRLAEDFRFYQDHKNLHADLDCNYQHWAGNGLNYYVATKLLWDPYCDIDAVIRDYCLAGFGPAADEIGKYFKAVEQMTDKIAAERQSAGPDTIARYYTDEALETLNQMLDEAERAAAQDETVLKRIEFLRTALEYAPVCRDYYLADAAACDGDKWQRRNYYEESVKRATWFQKLGPSWAVHAPWLLYQNW